MNILVTGSRGFIGRLLVQALSAHRVITSDRLSLPYATIDFALLPPVDQVFHLAWDGVPALTRSHAQENKVNVLPTQKFIVKAKKAGVKHFVFLSSAGAILSPSAYGYAKSQVETYLHNLATPDFKVTVIRATNVIGFDQKYKHGQGLLPYLKNALITQTPMTLYGHSHKDYLDVRDLISVLTLVHKQPAAFAIYPVGSGVILSLSDIISLIAPFTGNHHEINWLPAMPWDTQKVQVDLTTTLRDLGWRPRYDPRITIKKYFTYET